MRYILALSLFFGVSPVGAASLVRQGDGVRFVLHTDKPCEVPALIAGVMPELLSSINGGYLTVQGRTVRLCWARNENVALIKDEEGDGGLVDLTQFKEDLGV